MTGGACPAKWDAMMKVLRRARRWSTNLRDVLRQRVSRCQALRTAFSRNVQCLAVAIPILNSLPGAPATIYLDFDGHRQPSWGAYTDIVSPAYDLDHDRTTISEREVEAITEIWG